ncbi:putative Na(+)/H(+) antiporter [Fulvia fulva]|uniref:Na(+)/H(+) antiporter n=1 Tax=Passalora fulva TaxID=5499 RepID=A0A9Q8LBR1_PASFU|nr:putative Na(+)/H(+) antiporter [Fulvia fulva]KAK4632146.1 putative Na(+)/H(+) antiporter [Fulvia fulva]KAK4633507.1 putative Na(+)/H(+) antiporter [Fulvia fulva]UJO14456.1 putative Na(+)/H(+) antiporter [Fulvia fulva]WPV11069.1 putative Na(+)/H(+) antiporter [Fulvia fulva]WPV26480.1 putative Na(+)/H(+) antiporter [Fulvia fulva]
MAWDQLSINKPHLVYIILGGFTSLFMLCSSVIKERLYIGEATVATICGIIFGPHAANLINPMTWGNTDQITLEFSRIVLVVQCFAIGVELPKAYMERHWRSVVFLLIPVMTFGWLVTSLFIWAVFHGHLDWLESLTVAACVTATDPVLASSVVGKGKFAKRVPKHMRDLLSAESGCNDGMAFPFIYLALYILHYKPDGGHILFHWVCYTILYECVFGAFFGVMVGYIARRMIRYAHEKDLIDRESFLVYYFVLALFCAGAGSLLGLDDLLVGFACGVGFSNDGWFTEKTEESHVSNVIDLLINLAFFVYFGTIIPWEQYNIGTLGLDVWRLIVIALLVLFFRRIPIMLALKPLIPDIKTWREALFAGHFGPIGVGAIFVAILARAELETDSTTPLAVLPPDSTPEYNVIYLIWPITTFLVVVSIVVHGSSIAVFTLGKHINTLTLTMSYTQANEQSWMDRLPRIQSRSKSQMSAQSFDDEKGESGYLQPGTFLRRQKEEDNPSRAQSRASSRRRSRHSKSKSLTGMFGPGGPISQSAIEPSKKRDESPERGFNRSDSDTLAVKSDPPSDDKASPAEDASGSDVEKKDSSGEIYEEGQETVYEDEEGNVLEIEPSGGQQGKKREEHELREGRRLMHKEAADKNHGVAPTHDDPKTDSGREAVNKMETGKGHVLGEPDSKAKQRPGKGWREGWNKMSKMSSTAIRGRDAATKAKNQLEHKETRGPARAYQYGNTIIVEDEDGEVIRKYDIPAPDKKEGNVEHPSKTNERIGRMGKMLGLSSKEAKAEAGAPGPDTANAEAGPVDSKASIMKPLQEDDNRVRFVTQGGRRMSKAEFITQIRSMDPKSRVEAVEDSDVPEAVKREARKESREQALPPTPPRGREQSVQVNPVPTVAERPEAESQAENAGEAIRPAQVERTATSESTDLKLVTSQDEEVPVHDISSDLRDRRTQRQGEGGAERTETAAERRRRLAAARPVEDSDSEDDGTDRIPPARRHGASSNSPPAQADRMTADTGETAAERRRREGALGITGRDDSDSEDDDQPREAPQTRSNIRFADESATQQQPQRRLRWGKDVRQ